MTSPTQPATRRLTSVAGLLLTLVSGSAFAHPGHFHDTAASMLAAGWLHPLTGVDHLLARLAVGMWAATTQPTLSRALSTPVSFACLLLIGALAGIIGLALPAVEPMIMASLLVLGLLLAAQVRLSRTASAALVGAFALVHGLAHGAELPPDGSATLFILGFMLSTLVLHAVGLTAGFALKRRTAWFARAAGAGTAAYGLVLLAA